MGYSAADDRYDSMTYRRCGRSGLDLPAISLGLWHNFGDDVPFDRQRDILRRAFDLGVTHFDLANNYGPPYGSAESNFGRHLADDFRPYRDELVISTKAGYDMWPGPYGQGGGGRKYVLSSLDQSLARMGLDYVDIFYSHRPDPTTPLEETMGALHSAVDRKSTRLNSSHANISYAVFCLKKKKHLSSQRWPNTIPDTFTMLLMYSFFILFIESTTYFGSPHSLSPATS